MTCQNCTTVPLPQERPAGYRPRHRKPGPLAHVAAVLARAWRDDTPDTLPIAEMAGAQ